VAHSLAYSDVDLNASPVVVIPSCGHFFTLSTLDGHMHFDEYYATDKYGKFGPNVSLLSILQAYHLYVDVF
jgi:hypothetical protein